MSYIDDYRNAHYDRLAIRVKKGKREKFKARAAELGMSLAELVCTAVECYDKNPDDIQELIDERRADIWARRQEGIDPQLTPTQKKLLDDFDALPADDQKALLKFLQQLTENQQRE